MATLATLAATARAAAAALRPRLPAAPARPRDSIVGRLGLALGVLVALTAALGTLTVWGMQRSMEEVRRAEQSLAQIENARAIEAAFNRYLLDEIARRVTGGGDPAESAAAAAVRGALLIHRRTVGMEIATAATEAERAQERAEMVRSNAMGQIFETIETEAMLDRLAGGEFAAGRAARHFVERIAAERDDVFLAVLREILVDERAEAEAAFDALDRLRARLAVAWGLLAAALLAAAAGVALVFQRQLMRPIRALTDATEEVGGGRTARAPDRLPGEFAAFARSFNDMADRVEGARARLEAEVAARTAELSAANAELRRIDRTRRQFFANVSHELRTPVTVLLGEAQIALRGRGDSREALERIAASGGFLKRRLDDLMRLARSGDGALGLAMGRADLALAVGRAVEAARAYAAANEVTLDLAPPPPADWSLEGDEGALGQAALALLDNAVKFSPPGAAVAVSLSARAEEIGFEVADSGPGFGATDPAALFDRYAQEATGRAAGGSGLGLAIVRWIVGEHGGRVSAAARDGGGAVVSVSLPRRRAA